MGELDDCFILYAIYNLDSYDGWAFVLFLKDGKLYEVNISHCSCYGLEDQWEPEETTVLSVRSRIDQPNGLTNNAALELALHLASQLVSKAH